MSQGLTIKRAVAAVLTGAGLGFLGALLGPAGPASAATVPIDLWAVSGTTTLPGGQSVPVWGYRTTDGTVTRPGGPVLEVNEGDTVQITLHNQLAETTALLLQGQALAPDLAGVPASGTTTYTFTADHAGTYLYEAGLTPNSQHQVAMGLYGALVVRPAAANQAYAAASTAYDDEAVLVLGELDPALNNAGDKALFDMRKFNPRYFLINGQAHPDTSPIATDGGNTVLLRYVNAGVLYHSMGVLGAGQSVIALDGSPLDHARHFAAETFGPGQTADALVTAPGTAADQQRLSVYDANLLLHNSNTGGGGGMFTSIQVPGSGDTTDTTGPVTSAVGHDGSDLTATVDDSNRGGGTVTAAEFYLDDVSGAATAMAAADGSFDTASEQVTAPVTVTSGEHVLYVRGQDADGHWGPFSSVLVTGGDEGGPTTKSPILSPRLTTQPNVGGVAVTATGDDTDSGNSNVTAAEYFIDTQGADGTGTPMTAAPAAPVASLDATIPAATINGLAEGNHVIWIHARDLPGNWGDAITAFLVIDTTGPATSGVVVAPTPNNGTLPINAGTPAVRVTATTMSDPVSSSVNSPIAKAEAFIDTVGGNGSGIPLTASDGVFNDPTEGGYADIPLATVKALANGTHTLYVHARDDAGNWGPTATATLLVDKVAPALSGVSLNPNPTQGAGTVALAATASDNLTSVVAAEWFIGADPGAGNATPLTIAGTGPWSLSGTVNVANRGDGTYTVRVRAKDQAGNWGTPTSVVLTVSGPLFYSTVGNTNPPGVAGTADDADLYGWNGVTHARVFDATVAGLTAAANVDGLDRVDSTHFYLSFAGNTTVPGVGPVQDEDVVYYNAGTWSVWFDGTARGLTAAGANLDAISVSGSTLYFSTTGNVNPAGVGGVADDADIYSWNGTSFARVFDATVAGLPAATNVDGAVRVDGTHWYLSFGTATTAVPGAGTVQDEDVVFDNAGTWSVYFDGTAHGLGTSANLDIDAFDLP